MEEGIVSGILVEGRLAGCPNPDECAEGVYRCQDCYGGQLLCQPCILRSHRGHFLHRIEVCSIQNITEDHH